MVVRPLPGSLLVPVGVHLGVGSVVRCGGSFEQPCLRPTLEIRYRGELSDIGEFRLQFAWVT